MYNHARRYAQLATFALAALVGAVVAHAVAWSLGQAGWADRALVGVDQLHVSSLLGAGFAVLLAVLVLTVPTPRQWSLEVVQELLRVNWPTRPEVVRATWVVICTVAVCTLYLGFLDALWLWLTDSLLGVGGGDKTAAVGLGGPAGWGREGLKV